MMKIKELLRKNQSDTICIKKMKKSIINTPIVIFLRIPAL